MTLSLKGAAYWVWVSSRQQTRSCSLAHRQWLDGGLAAIGPFCVFQLTRPYQTFPKITVLYLGSTQGLSIFGDGSCMGSYPLYDIGR